METFKAGMRRSTLLITLNENLLSDQPPDSKETPNRGYCRYGDPVVHWERPTEWAP